MIARRSLARRSCARRPGRRAPCPPSGRRGTPRRRSRTRRTFPPVAELLVVRCGSLDCHGTAARNLRLYGSAGLRWSPRIARSCPACDTPDEVDAGLRVGRRPRARGDERRRGGRRARTPSGSRWCARRAVPRRTRAGRSGRRAMTRTRASRRGSPAARTHGACAARHGQRAARRIVQPAPRAVPRPGRRLSAGGLDAPVRRATPVEPGLHGFDVVSTRRGQRPPASTSGTSPRPTKGMRSRRANSSSAATRSTMRVRFVVGRGVGARAGDDLDVVEHRVEHDRSIRTRAARLRRSPRARSATSSRALVPRRPQPARLDVLADERDARERGSGGSVTGTSRSGLVAGARRVARVGVVRLRRRADEGQPGDTSDQSTCGVTLESTA